MEHLLNLFGITNLDQLSCSYRLLKVEGLIRSSDNPDLAERNLNLLVKRVAYENRAPVALVRHGGLSHLAVPFKKDLERYEYSLVPDVLTLKPLEERRELKFTHLTPEKIPVALSFIRFALRTPLIRDNSLWGSGISTFFQKRPVSWKDDARETDVYGGFGFRLLWMEGKIYLAIRLSHKYVDRRWLTDRCANGDLNDYRMRHMLYHYGHRWFMVQFLGQTGHSLLAQKFHPEGQKITDVYSFTLEAAGSNPPSWITALNPDSLAINFRYPGNQKRRFGAAALCKLALSTDDPQVKRLHRESIKPPQERFIRTQELVDRHFSHVSLDGVPIEITTDPLRVKPKVFPVPDQLFGQGHILRIRSQRNPGGTPLKQLGARRMDILQDPEAGGLVASPFDAQYLLAPTRLPRQIVEDFQERFQKTITQFVQSSFSMQLVLYDDRNASTLREQVNAILHACDQARINRGCGVLILPPSAKPDLHNFIKRKLRNRLQCQCVLADNLRTFYPRVERNRTSNYLETRTKKRIYASYLRYTAFGHLIVNRKWLWALASPLHYDVYIGLDVLNNTAAFTFLYDRGERCFTFVHESKQKEKLLSQQFRDIVYRHLKDGFKDADCLPGSVVIHRDGRTYSSEWTGFEQAIEMLQHEGLLPEDVKYGIVEIDKDSALGLRLVADRGGRLVNPTVGSWFTLNGREGIVCNTGWPFSLPGTVKPLLVKIAYGNLEIQFVLEDIFRFSHLCWMTPDRCSRLPITVKLPDEFLRPVAAEADDDEAIYGEEILARRDLKLVKGGTR